MSTSRTPAVILMTGATSAIGSALARIYAAPGVTLLLHGRDQVKLAEVVAECERRGAHVVTASFDVRDIETLRSWVTESANTYALDLVIANAGINIDNGPDNIGESWEDMDRLVDVNVKAAMSTVRAAVPSMRQRGRGHLVLMSSLAAYYGLPVTPSYSGSKAMVKAYGEALRGWLSSEGINVTVVMPGYVESRMCSDMPGPKPFLWTPDKAATVIRNGLRKQHPLIRFPFWLGQGCWWLSVLPPSWSDRILKWMGYGG